MSKQRPLQRILLKLSGESLKGSLDHGVEGAAATRLALTIKAFHAFPVQLGVVIGGGNIFRGIQGENLGMPRAPADHMGMLATLINGIALEQAIKNVGVPVRLMSAIDCPKVAEPYQWGHANEALSRNEVVIFVGGTGNPYFTTDTNAALRASEIEAQVVLKATKVDGVYSADPKTNPDAQFFPVLSYEEVLARKFGVMDSTAVALCRQQGIPIYIFNMKHLQPADVEEVLNFRCGGTIIKNGD